METLTSYVPDNSEHDDGPYFRVSNLNYEEQEADGRHKCVEK